MQWPHVAQGLMLRCPLLGLHALEMVGVVGGALRVDGNEGARGMGRVVQLSQERSAEGQDGGLVHGS